MAPDGFVGTSYGSGFYTCEIAQLGYRGKMPIPEILQCAAQAFK
jgi:hypothetical protein